MNTVMKIKTGLMALSLALLCGTTTATAQHHRHRHVVKTVVVKPKVVVKQVTTSNACDRLAVATNYIKSNGKITIKKYARLTGLTYATAEAELNAFAADKRCPVIAIPKGKKIVYTLKG